jgi:hypothetical protein
MGSWKPSTGRGQRERDRGPKRRRRRTRRMRPMLLESSRWCEPRNACRVIRPGAKRDPQPAVGLRRGLLGPPFPSFCRSDRIAPLASRPERRGARHPATGTVLPSAFLCRRRCMPRAAVTRTSAADARGPRFVGRGLVFFLGRSSAEPDRPRPRSPKRFCPTRILARSCFGSRRQGRFRVAPPRKCASRLRRDGRVAIDRADEQDELLRS